MKPFNNNAKTNKLTKYFLILMTAMTFYQCNLEPLIPFHLGPDFPVDTIIVDTIPVDTIVIDTPPPCIVPIEIIEPKFITYYNEYFNGVPDSLVWYFHKGQGNDIAYPTLMDLLIGQGYHQDSIEIYEDLDNSKSIAAIIRGTNDKTKLQGRIWTRDQIGQKAFGALSLQGFIFGGALTFAEYKSVAERFPSVRSFNFRNTTWTQAQYEEVALIILGECKKGRYDANFMFNALPISDNLYCQFIERKWQIVRGQTPNCIIGQPFIGPIMKEYPIKYHNRA